MTGNIPVNVAFLIPWKQLLPALELQANSGALPCTARCPACHRASLVLYPLPGYPQNTTPGGQWHYCSACKLAGDNLELAARTWQVDVLEAAARLVRLGLLPEEAGRPEALETYRHAFPNRRKEAQAFWKVAQEHFPAAGPDLALFKAHVGYPNLLDKGLASRSQRFVGGMRREDILEFLGPQRIAMRGSRLKVRPRPESWQEASVVAFEDVPGRLSAFLFIVGGAEADQMAYRTTDRGSEFKTPVPTGMAFMHTLASDAEMTIPLVLSLNVKDALHWHLWGQARNSRLFPVLACWPASPPPVVLKGLAGTRKIVVWNHEKTADLYRHAKALDAFVSVPANRQQARPTHAVCWSLEEHLETLNAHSRYWMDSLHELLLSNSPAVADSWLEQIGMTPEEQRLFLNRGSGELKERAHTVTGLTRQCRQTVIGNTVVCETENGWYTDKGALISEAVMRIDVALHQKESNNVWYQGRLLFRGQEYPFSFSQAQFNSDRTAATIRTHMVQLGAGVPRIASGWGFKLLEVALAFHQPSETQEVADYGWNEASQRFLFPHYAIELGGKVIELQIPKLHGRRVPGAGLPKPVALFTDELAVLLQTPARDVVWSTLLMLFHNLLAEAYHYTPLGLASPTREVALAANSVAKAAGCYSLTSSPRVDRETTAGRSWPTVLLDNYICPLSSHPNWHDWLKGPQNVLVEMGPVRGRVAFINGNWFFLDREYSQQPEPQVLSVVTRLVPDFLQFMLEQRLGGGLWGVEPLQRVREEMGRYLKARGLDADLEELTNALRWQAADRVECFGQFLAYLIDEGMAQALITKDFEKAQKRWPGRLILKHASESLWVPKLRLNSFLLKQRLPMLELHTLAGRLDAAGALKEDLTDVHEPCWRLSHDWWRSTQKAWRARRRGLRLVK